MMPTAPMDAAGVVWCYVAAEEAKRADQEDERREAMRMREPGGRAHKDEVCAG